MPNLVDDACTPFPRKRASRAAILMKNFDPTDFATVYITLSLPCGSKTGRICCMKYWQIPLVILAALSVSIALADDFKTTDGKEYKNVNVSRVEPDGIVLKSKSGISKVYFVELPKEVQERFHYNTAKAAQQRVQQQQPSVPIATATPDVQKRAASQTTEQRENEEAIKQHHALIGMTAAQVRQAWG
ncbi:MAG: hypothetical protein DME75_07795, partial [Verrucomicrobia bacterium]